MCHLWWRQLKSIWGILLSASQESNTEGERGGRRKQLSKAVLECSFRSQITHSAWGTQGRWQEHKEEGGQVWNSAFSYFFPFRPSFDYMSSFGKLSIWEKLLLKHYFFLSTILFLFFLFLFLFFPSSLPLRAGGETMIKSSWFYVKFKYAEKVSQYVFFSQGKPATSLQASHVDGLPWLLREADEPRSFICECISSGLMILGWNASSMFAT